MKKYYDLNDSLFKIFRVIPGLVTIILLTSPIWATLLGHPEWVLYYVTFLAVFWLYKSFTSAVGNYIGFLRYDKAIKEDWQQKVKELDWNALPEQEDLPSSLEDLDVSVIIPFYKEPYQLLIESLDAVKASEFDLKKIYVVLAVEESGGPEAEENAKKLLEHYKGVFKDIRYYIHPKDIPGEIKGIAGANLRYAAQQFVKELKAEKYNLKNNIMVKYDSDLKIHPKFIPAFVYTYLTSLDRYHAFYSPALMLYSNNYWRVPVLMRVFVGSLTLAILSEWITNKKSKQSFSCYGFNLDLLDKIDYWDPLIGVDDTSFYWNAYLHLDGRFRGEEFYIPTYSDAVESGSFIKTHKDQYKQLLRWGWGVVVFPITLQGVIRNQKIPIHKRIVKVMDLFQVYNLWVTISFLLSFAIPIIALISKNFEFYGVAHVLPRIISALLTASFGFLIPSRWILEKLYGAPPKSKGTLFYIWHYVEQVLLTINMLTYNFFPHLQAQLEMMIGKKKNHLVTPKIRT